MRTLRVAAGILKNSSGEILVAQRPPHVSMAGYWEFPGGKVNVDETSVSALRRELQEELAIMATCTSWFISATHEYPDRIVHLDFWKVLTWRGTVMAKEGQPLIWSTLKDLANFQWLPADWPVVNKLQTAYSPQK